jgi:uncharacterized protein
MLDLIADGRPDLVFPDVVEWHAASSADSHGMSLIQWCAYYGDVSAIRGLARGGARVC